MAKALIRHRAWLAPPCAWQALLQPASKGSLERAQSLKWIHWATHGRLRSSKQLGNDPCAVGEAIERDPHEACLREPEIG